MSDTIRTLWQFLDATQTHYRVFDLGRRIVKIPQQQFIDFEEARIAYPQPLQQHAWLGIVGQNRKNREEHFVWFLRFRLDEQGKLIQAARDDFLESLLTTVGGNIAAQSEEELQDLMSESPHGFKPKQENMASFHAKALKSLGLPPSRYFAHARDYFAGKPGWDQWAFVGLQGIADMAARWDEDDHEAILTAAIPHLPDEPFVALCHCLEHEAYGVKLAEAIAERIDALWQQADTPMGLVASGLRALSHCKASGLRQGLLDRLLADERASNIDLLAAIAARCWEDLKEDEARRRRYVEAVAEAGEPEQVFTPIMADLMFLPGMRELLLKNLRDPGRSEALSRAVEVMFKTQI